MECAPFFRIFIQSQFTSGRDESQDLFAGNSGLSQSREMSEKK
jgi:hypothetical protein